MKFLKWHIHTRSCNITHLNCTGNMGSLFPIWLYCHTLFTCYQVTRYTLGWQKETWHYFHLENKSKKKFWMFNGIVYPLPSNFFICLKAETRYSQSFKKILLKLKPTPSHNLHKHGNILNQLNAQVTKA